MEWCHHHLQFIGTFLCLCSIRITFRNPPDDVYKFCEPCLAESLLLLAQFYIKLLFYWKWPNKSISGNQFEVIGINKKKLWSGAFLINFKKCVRAFPFLQTPQALVFFFDWYVDFALTCLYIEQMQV